ncbi:hypothetical protein PVAP13_4NG126819 [Panicum virgatum]|nr:hypothetical protein PVAP13_4NG126819 [Panicum virgatum]KAG2604906.1 hypothetical protein PVAP13_4NG126819 [Panicum virgatum]
MAVTVDHAPPRSSTVPGTSYLVPALLGLLSADGSLCALAHPALISAPTHSHPCPTTGRARALRPSSPRVHEDGIARRRPSSLAPLPHQSVTTTMLKCSRCNPIPSDRPQRPAFCNLASHHLRRPDTLRAAGAVHELGDSRITSTCRPPGARGPRHGSGRRPAHRRKRSQKIK